MNAIALGEHTPLHRAVRLNHFEMAELLIKYGANVNTTNARGKTALDIAIENDNTEIINILRDESDSI